MDLDVDHYLVLGLPSGEEGAELSEKEISKAYRAKALELHPDKRPDDPDAHTNFQRLKTSYEILKDEKLRKAFDDRLRARREQQRRQTQQDSKRRKMVSDLEERERAAFAPDPSSVVRQEEERIARKLKEEIATIRAMHMNKGAGAPASKETTASSLKETTGGSGLELDKERVLKFTWEKVGADYSPERLKEIFSEFGMVEDVVIWSSKKRGSALVVMGSKDAVIAAYRNCLWRSLKSFVGGAPSAEKLLGGAAQPRGSAHVVPPPTEALTHVSAADVAARVAMQRCHVSALHWVVAPRGGTAPPKSFSISLLYQQTSPAFRNLWKKITSIIFVGARYREFEDSVLKKLQKAAQNKK